MRPDVNGTVWNSFGMTGWRVPSLFEVGGPIAATPTKKLEEPAIVAALSRIQELLYIVGSDGITTEDLSQIKKHTP